MFSVVIESLQRLAMLEDSSEKIMPAIQRFVYAHSLLDTNAPGNQDQLIEILEKYKQELGEAGCSPQEIEGYMKLEFLMVHVEFVKHWPSNHADLSNVLIYHLLVESQMRRFLSVISPHIDWFSEKLTFEALADLCKKFASPIAARRFNAGIKEMARIRNFYAHRIDYCIKDEDVGSMLKFIYATPSGKVKSYTAKTAFKQFCYLAFAHFQFLTMHWLMKDKNKPDDELA